MKPLAWIALGTFVILVRARIQGYDVLPDPAGWAMILVGAAFLPLEGGARRTLVGLGALAGLISCALWVPAVIDRLAAGDAGLAWSAEVPKYAFLGYLSHLLAGRAAAADDPAAAFWWRVVMIAAVVAALLPVLWLGADLAFLAAPSDLAAGGSLVLTVVLGIVYAGSAWSRPVADRRGTSSGA